MTWEKEVKDGIKFHMTLFSYDKEDDFEVIVSYRSIIDFNVYMVDSNVELVGRSLGCFRSSQVIESIIDHINATNN